MPTTSNFGWTTPADTDLVKDGAAAIRTLGNGIDTSFVDLKGGTTGQILSKASNTDLDFTWTSDATGISATIFDAKGDLIAASAADTAARLAVGANGTVLTADSTETTGLKWATPVSWSPNFTLLNSGGTALTGAATITVNVSAYDVYFVRLESASSANASSTISFRINSDSGSNYSHVYLGHESYTSVADGTQFSQTDYRLALMGDNASRTVSAYFTILGGKNAGIKTINSVGFGSPNASGVTNYSFVSNGFWNNTSAVSSISIISSTGNFDAGTVFVYGG